MKEDNIDGIFSDKLKDKVTIPANIEWNKDKGWKELEKTLPNPSQETSCSSVVATAMWWCSNTLACSPNLVFG